nr:RNA-binding protein NOB1 [Ipomoea batatas]
MEVQPTAQSQPQPPQQCWSNIVKQQLPPPPPPQQQNHQSPFAAAPPRELVGSCNSTKGIAVAVVDANAIIHGGQNLSHNADRFVSVPEVLSEIRDPTSRHSLNFLPFTVDTMEPSPDALKRVINFARATGDLQTLSDVDLKLIALTYMLESQIHGTQHLRDAPPPIHTVNVRRLPEKDMPGWGSNVPNLEEWEALEHAVEGGSNTTSRILPLKDLSMNVVPTDQQSIDGSTVNDSKSQSEDQEDADGGFRGPRKYKPQKKEVKIEGKKMVADGVDASQGQYDDDAGDWLPAVNLDILQNKVSTDITDGNSAESESNDFKSSGTADNINGDVENVEDDVDNLNEMASQTCESIETSQMDDSSSEQSWMLRSLSESTVACITSDFAMQNVILQMGLRLLAPGGMQIRELHRWVLKCHACYKVTTEIGRIFCPSCGNGGTLRKVAVTVGENGMPLPRTPFYVRISFHRSSCTLKQRRRIKRKALAVFTVSSHPVKKVFFNEEIRECLVHEMLDYLREFSIMYRKLKHSSVTLARLRKWKFKPIASLFDILILTGVPVIYKKKNPDHTSA